MLPGEKGSFTGILEIFLQKWLRQDASAIGCESCERSGMDSNIAGFLKDGLSLRGENPIQKSSNVGVVFLREGAPDRRAGDSVKF